jgi:hypothetical protein
MLTDFDPACLVVVLIAASVDETAGAEYQSTVP